MPRLPVHCPSCHTDLCVERLHCRACDVRLDGEFELPPLLRLSADELDFVIRFVLASGSLKEMARQMQLSYPTVRNRLNDLIENLQAAIGTRAGKRLEILDAIARGTLSVAEGEQALRRIGHE